MVRVALQNVCQQKIPVLLSYEENESDNFVGLRITTYKDVSCC